MIHCEQCHSYDKVYAQVTWERFLDGSTTGLMLAIGSYSCSCLVAAAHHTITDNTRHTLPHHLHPSPQPRYRAP